MDTQRLSVKKQKVKERGSNMKCVICNEKITADPFGWEGGCNAEPVASGQCCEYCDDNVVLPARFIQYGIKMKGDA